MSQTTRGQVSVTNRLCLLVTGLSGSDSGVMFGEIRARGLHHPPVAVARAFRLLFPFNVSGWDTSRY